MKSYICKHCDLVFQSKKECKSRFPKYCSRKCYSKAERSPETRKKQSLAKIGKEPANKLPTGFISCSYCGEKIVIKIGAYYKPKYCSLKCRDQAYKHLDYSQYKGANSHFWKGGVTEENELERKSGKYRNWRKSIFERDKYTCQICGQIGGCLQADHIKPFAYHKELRFDINNGRTLCIKCHHNTNTFGSKAYNYGNKTNTTNSTS